jgi:hypothetical protein
MCGFAANNATIVAVQEADQTQVRCLRALENGWCIHITLLLTYRAPLIAAALALRHTVAE